MRPPSPVYLHTCHTSSLTYVYRSRTDTVPHRAYYFLLRTALPAPLLGRTRHPERHRRQSGPTHHTRTKQLIHECSCRWRPSSTQCPPAVRQLTPRLECIPSRRHARACRGFPKLCRRLVGTSSYQSRRTLRTP